MKKIVLLFVVFAVVKLEAQVSSPDAIEKRRTPTKQEIKMLAHLADSVLSELKVLYKLEVKENSPRKYQPERIALVRSYLLVFQNIESSCSIIAYSMHDIKQIFGKPDTTFKVTRTNKVKEVEWLYEGIEKKYIRINNLRYRFYFKNEFLEAVKRDDK